MIKLKQVRLINWYAFGQITVPMGSFTRFMGIRCSINQRKIKAAERYLPTPEDCSMQQQAPI